MRFQRVSTGVEGQSRPP